MPLWSPKYGVRSPDHRRIVMVECKLNTPASKGLGKKVKSQLNPESIDKPARWAIVAFRTNFAIGSQRKVERKK